MWIDTADLGDDAHDYEGEEPTSALDMGDRLVAPCSALRYRLTARVADGRLVVQGRLATTVEFACSRCGEPFRTNIADPAFSRVYELEKTGQSVDLTPDMREAMLLAFPTYPLCDEGCRGVCPGCGANRNRATCACRRTDGHGWSMLDGLKLEQ